MRKEVFGVGDYVHVVNRGVKKLPIVKDLDDKRHFLKILYYFNDEYSDLHWKEKASQKPPFVRPEQWPERRPLVEILAFCLMPNHFHLWLREIIEGGISKFVQKISNSLTSRFNLKYNESGTIFEGSYKSRRVDSDEYLRYLAVYIMVKNPFELYKGGIKKAVGDFDNAFAWASEKYMFSSLPDFTQKHEFGIIDKSILFDIFETNNEFKEYSKEIMLGMDFSKIEHLLI